MCVFQLPICTVIIITPRFVTAWDPRVHDMLKVILDLFFVGPDDDSLVSSSGPTKNRSKVGIPECTAYLDNL